jgi:hypothetical protein
MRADGSGGDYRREDRGGGGEGGGLLCMGGVGWYTGKAPECKRAGSGHGGPGRGQARLRFVSRASSLVLSPYASGTYVAFLQRAIVTKTRRSTKRLPGK